MADIERMTVTLTAEQVIAVKEAVNSGAYASSSEIVREALRDWMHKQQLRQGELATLRRDIQAGLDDIKAGRVHDFDVDEIVKEGKRRFADRSRSA